ncbi:MAG: hypothetical protein NVS9B15_16910 [Acidobacteriaceae bacterium]
MVRGLSLLILELLICSVLWAGPIGVFQGELLDGPQSGWLYVKGQNGMLRRVQLGKAHVVYGTDVPASRRGGDAAGELLRGAVVKVTAEQGSDGEWMAQKVVLVHLAAERRQSATAWGGVAACECVRHWLSVGV